MVDRKEEALVKEERRPEVIPAAVPPPIFLQRLAVMTPKYRGCIVVLLINKSVEPNKEQKVLTSGFDQGFTVNTSKQIFRGIW
jgi:hypothetical protein